MRLQALIPLLSKKTSVVFQLSAVQVLKFIKPLPVFMTSSYVFSTDTPTPELLTVELLFRHLLPHSSKWQSLGEALSLDDERLDEIYTNDESEEDCLREILELYMMRSDLNHSWDEVHQAVKKVEGAAANQTEVNDCGKARDGASDSNLCSGQPSEENKGEHKVLLDQLLNSYMTEM